MVGSASDKVRAGGTPKSGGRALSREGILRDARAHLQAGAHGLALETLNPALMARRPDAEALHLASVICLHMRRADRAKHYAERSLAGAESPQARLVLAQCERQAGETDRAVSHCDKAARGAMSRPARIMKAGALEEAGRFDEARAVVDELMGESERSGSEPESAVVFERAKLLVQSKEYSEAVGLLDGLIGAGDAPPEVRRAHLHLRAKACDRMKDYAGAMESASGANEIGKVEYSPELYEQQVTALMEVWSAENLARFPRSSCESAVAVFVAGMPRSGTSLIDQIIDAHPKAGGVGELSTIEGLAMRLSQVYDADKDPPECFGEYRHNHKWTDASNRYLREIKKQAPRGAERIVNKALGNNKLVGLIARLFPNTRIIHAVRDPRDVAVSCFMGGFNNNLHAWTTQLDWVASAWAQSMRMMEHWKRVLDVPILDVHYEKLVNQPDTEFPRIIEFLGLEWDEACREFHRSRRTVRTLSYDQVNRPLYTTSAGRHANYAPWLEGIEWAGV